MNGIIGKRSAAGVLGVVAMMVAVSGCDSDAASGSVPRVSVVASVPPDWRPGDPSVLRYQMDAARGRLWALTADGVDLYDVASRQRLAQIALQVSLNVGGKPERAVGVARDGQRGRITASQQPGRPVAGFGRPLANVEIGSEEPVERLEGGLPLLPFRGTEGWQFQIDRASRQRVCHAVHEQEIGRTGEEEVARPALLVHGAFDGQKQRWCALHFIESDGTAT